MMESLIHQSMNIIFIRIPIMYMLIRCDYTLTSL